MSPGVQNARSLIERGLASYGRGELQQALGQWREALRLEPGNTEAHKLVSFVEERMSATTPVPPESASRGPSPMPAVGGKSPRAVDGWDAEEGTPSESDVQTAARLIRAEVAFEDAADGVRKRRPTLVSMLPELLAPSTLPEDMRRTATVMVAVSANAPVPQSAPAPVEPASRAVPSNDGVPQAAVNDVVTRQVELAPSGPHKNRTAHRADTPLDLALAEARDRGKILVRQCSDALAAGKNEAAAAAAEEALQEAEKSPAPGIGEVVGTARSTLERAFFAHLGSTGVPTMAVDDATVNASSFDHRTGFLLSCIDGTLPIETLIDISGMGRFEAMRTLSRLLRRKIIKVG